MMAALRKEKQRLYLMKNLTSYWPPATTTSFLHGGCCLEGHLETNIYTFMEKVRALVGKDIDLKLVRIGALHLGENRAQRRNSI